MLLRLYILREHIGPFFLGFLTLTGILIMNQIFLLVWDIIGKGLAVSTVLWVLCLYLPSILSLTIPMGVLVASCMAFGRFSADSEITAIRASGINPLKLNILPLFSGLLLFIFMVWFNNHIYPESNHLLKNILLDIAHEKPAFKIKALVTIKDFEQYDMWVRKVDYKESSMEGIKLFEKQTGREIFARTGVFKTNPNAIVLTLKDGEIHELMESGKYRKLDFNEYHIPIPIDTQSVSRDRKYRGNREISARQIKQRIQEIQKEKEGPYRKKRINSLLVEYHKKYSIAFACFAFVLLGAPLSIKARTRGISAGFGMPFLFFIFYYICLVGGENLGDRGVIPPWLAMWFPIFVLLILSVWATFRANK